MLRSGYMMTTQSNRARDSSIQTVRHVKHLSFKLYGIISFHQWCITKINFLKSSKSSIVCYLMHSPYSLATHFIDVCLCPQLFFIQLLVALTQQVKAHHILLVSCSTVWMSESSITLLFAFFLSVDDSHHSEFHETSRGEEDRMAVSALLRRKQHGVFFSYAKCSCASLVNLCVALLCRTWICPGWRRHFSD